LFSAWALLPGLLLAGWLARNVILTGWLFFPAPIGHLPVDWAVPELPANGSHVAALQSVRGDYDVNRGWARRPDAECVATAHAPLADWWPDWWRRHRGAPEWILLAAGFALAALAGVCGKWRQADLPLRVACWVTVGNLAQWFLLSPEWRFGDAFFSIWLGLGAVLLWPAEVMWRPLHTRMAALAIACLGWWCLHTTTVPQDVVWWQIGNSGHGHCQQVTVQNGQHPPLVLWASDGSDQCGDAPLPCTPYPRDVLCLRVPGDLRHGFYVKPSAGARKRD